MKIFKKNQLVILVIALMLITAGYLSYDARNNEDSIMTASNNVGDDSNFGDAEFVNSGNVSTHQEGLVENDNASSISTVAETEKGDNNEYFINSRLEREKMYSEMLENYQKIISNTNSLEDQKTKAGDEVKKISDIKNSIMIAENLVKTKGFSDVIIFVNDDSVNVIVKADKLEQDDVAQIQSIVTRELKVKAENMHISNK